jgi:hypothetical protein
MLTLISLLADEDVTAMYDEAFKKQPGNEELGAQTFMANAKISNWKIAQQVSIVHSVSDPMWTIHIYKMFVHFEMLIASG